MVIDTTVHDRSGLLLSGSPSPTDADINQVQQELHKLAGDLQFWLGIDSTMSRLEALSRFHHRAVWIHPFDNGNGRWSRLATDAIAVRQYKLDFLTWAKAGDGLRDPDGPERQTYIAAIKAGDKGNFDPLIAYIGERNDGI